MNSIHLSTARKIMMAPEPVTIRYIKADGSITTITNCIPLRYNFYEGTQQFKILSSNQIRTLRHVQIIAINDMEVFL